MQVYYRIVGTQVHRYVGMQVCLGMQVCSYGGMQVRKKYAGM